MRLGGIRYIVLIISLAMFCFQLRIAVINLISPPTVDSTIEKDITEVDLPIITICPYDQTNLTRLREIGGWSYVHSMVKDYVTCMAKDCDSWGKRHDLTFQEILNQTLDASIAEEIIFEQDDEVGESQIVYLYRYGFCKEISEYDPSREIDIVNERNVTMRLFITDQTKRTYFSFDISSHQGEHLIIKPGRHFSITISLQVSSTCNVQYNGKYGYKSCVEEEIQNNVGKQLGCIPPWLSPHNQCIRPFSNKINFDDEDFEAEYVLPLWFLRKTQAEIECRKFCSHTSSHVNIRDQLLYVDKGRPDKAHIGKASIIFDPTVYETEKMFNYGPFEFIIDVGSSVGLWLGLSVFGLYDLAIEFYELIKRAVHMIRH